jgi:hypothetical protein
MEKINITKKEELRKAYNDCIREIFAKANPSADWDNAHEQYQEYCKERI